MRKQPHEYAWGPPTDAMEWVPAGRLHNPTVIGIMSRTPHEAVAERLREPGGALLIVR